jgi:hypothetical protein
MPEGLKAQNGALECLQIRIKMKSWIRIRNKIKSCIRIPIGIKVMMIRIPGKGPVKG